MQREEEKMNALILVLHAFKQVWGPPVREEARLFEWLRPLERLRSFNQRMQPFLAAKNGSKISRFSAAQVANEGPFNHQTPRAPRPKAQSLTI